MKKTMIALVATIMAGACVFFACSKEEDRTIKNENEQDVILGLLEKDENTGYLSITPTFDTKKSMKDLEILLNNDKSTNPTTLVENIGFYIYEDTAHNAIFPLLQVGLFYTDKDESENIFIELQKIETSDKIATNSYFGIVGDITYSCSCKPDSYCNEGAPEGRKGCYPIKVGNQWDCSPCFSKRGVCTKTVTATEIIESISLCLHS